MAWIPRTRDFHPSTRPVEPAVEEAPQPKRKPGRPKGSRNTPREVPVRHQKLLGVRYADYPEIPPEFWNLLASLMVTIFKGLLKIASKLRLEAPGHEQEQILFRELPKVLFKTVREIAAWWWSHDNGMLGTTLTCPECGQDLGYKGNVGKGIMTPFGWIKPRRAYYVCRNQACRFSVCPLDVRLGVDKRRFLPSVQEMVTWMTSMDPYGKCLEFVARLLEFTISHRSAWLITQYVGELAKARQQEAITAAFGNPAAPVFPQAEVAPSEVLVVQVDGTCGRIDKDESNAEAEEDDDPDAPEDRKPDFREVKLGLVAHLVPPTAKPRRSPADKAPAMPRKAKKRKVRPEGQEPTLAHKKWAVHLGAPLVLFQCLLLLLHRLNIEKAKTLVVIGDGARWIWKGVGEHFSSLGVRVVEILDYWHAVEHVWAAGRAAYGQGTQACTAWVEARKAELLRGAKSDFFGAQKKAIELATSLPNDAALAIQKELNYFRNNESRIDYAWFLSQGFLIGSGAMEGSCRHHVKDRIDGPGMQWGPTGVMAVLQNRTLIKNGDWDAFWGAEATRRAQRYKKLMAQLTTRQA